MASTKRTISEQIKRRLTSGNPSVASKVHALEIDAAVMQVLNSLLRTQFFETLQTDGNIPEGCVLCTYEDVAVTAWNGISKSTLPAIPVSLPKNMGVFRISKSEDPLNTDFIPVPNGQFAMVSTQRLMSDLLDQIGYEVRGKEIYYTKDLTAMTPAANSVAMQLVVMDMSKFTDYEILPIDANMEAQVIETVIKMFAGQPVQPQTVDSNSDTKN
jgi:hypothetical protein